MVSDRSNVFDNGKRVNLLWTFWKPEVDVPAEEEPLSVSPDLLAVNPLLEPNMGYHLNLFTAPEPIVDCWHVIQ